MTAECSKGEQTRFEDNCYEYASSSSPVDIVSNIDACKAKGGDLWVPGTSAEHHFVSQTFPSATSDAFHLGILHYTKTDGFYGVDHSYSVGSPFFSLDNDVNGYEGKFIDGTNGPCLVFNKTKELWEKIDSCINATGVCKSRLGM